MIARPPTEALVIDSNIVVSAVLSQRARDTLASVKDGVQLFFTERGVHEVYGVLGRIEATQEVDRELASEIVHGLNVALEEIYRDSLNAAATTMRLANKDRKGDERDAHVLALAWALDADIWSHDRDFAGTGWPSWSSANLAAALTVNRTAP